MGNWFVDKVIKPTSQAIYTGTDFVLLGGLPDYGPGSALPAGVSYQDSLVGGVLASTKQAATDAGQVPTNLTAGVPGTAANIGQAPLQLLLPTFQQGLPALGSGLGSGLEGLLGGVGSGLGQATGKGLLPLGLLLAGIVVVVMVAGSRTGTTREVSRAVAR